MRVAPSFRAWSRNALNLISALHSTSGFGVRPAEYSRRNSANTRSRYSAAKLTASMSTPITSAALAASIRSCRVEQYSPSSSSSQFFMNRPTTSKPRCLSSQAATDESTPPDMPTTTRSPAPSCAASGSASRPTAGATPSDMAVQAVRIRVDQLEREPLAGEVIVDRLHDQRAAMQVAARADLVCVEPDRPQDAAVERPRRLVRARVAGEGETQVGDVRAAGSVLVARHVDADAGHRLDLPGGLLERLARHRLQQRLARIEVAGRLVDPHAFERRLLDQQEPAVALDHRGDGRVRFPVAHRLRCDPGAMPQRPMILEGGAGFRASRNVI